MKFLIKRTAVFLVLSLFLLVLAAALPELGVDTGLLLIPFAVLPLCAYILLRIIIPYGKFKKHLESYIYGYEKNLYLPGRELPSPLMEKLFRKIDDDLRTESTLKSANRLAEYLALQNQINPHFLYNTLEGIRSDVLEEGSTQIAGIIEALATYFRYTISKIDVFVTLEEELTNLQTYLSIQNYRFGDKINLIEKFDRCDRAVYQYYIPKLILQPFVENAIIHGLECQIGPGIITIRYSFTREFLLLSIEDNGIGIEEDRMNRINEPLNTVSIASSESEKGGIAIRNVNNRIKLLFGDRYGVKIRSIREQGTCVDLVLPLINKSGEKIEV